MHTPEQNGANKAAYIKCDEKTMRKTLKKTTSSNGRLLMSCCSFLFYVGFARIHQTNAHLRCYLLWMWVFSSSSSDKNETTSCSWKARDIFSSWFKEVFLPNKKYARNMNQIIPSRCEKCGEKKRKHFSFDYIKIKQKSCTSTKCWLNGWCRAVWHKIKWRKKKHITLWYARTRKKDIKYKEKLTFSPFVWEQADRCECSVFFVIQRK